MDVIESLDVDSAHSSADYWLSPPEFGTANAAYEAGWELNRDIVVGEPDARYDPRDVFDLRGPLPAPNDDCPALPARVLPWGGARVIVETLNFRSGPSLYSKVLVGMGQGSTLRIQTSTMCTGGFRWWYGFVNPGDGGLFLQGWVAESDANNYFIEPAEVVGYGEVVRRPTAVPTQAPTETPRPIVAQPTNPPAPTAKPTATPTDPTPG
jgi:hypothetical protein